MKRESARDKIRPAKPRCNFQRQPQSGDLSRRVPPPGQVLVGQTAQREPPQAPRPLTQKLKTCLVMRRCSSEEWFEREMTMARLKNP